MVADNGDNGREEFILLYIVHYDQSSSSSPGSLPEIDSVGGGDCNVM